MHEISRFIWEFYTFHSKVIFQTKSLLIVFVKKLREFLVMKKCLSNDLSDHY